MSLEVRLPRREAGRRFVRFLLPGSAILTVVGVALLYFVMLPLMLPLELLLGKVPGKVAGKAPGRAPAARPPRPNRSAP